MSFAPLAAFIWTAEACDPTTSEWLKAIGVVVIGGLVIFTTFAVPATATLARMANISFGSGFSETSNASAQQKRKSSEPPSIKNTSTQEWLENRQCAARQERRVLKLPKTKRTRATRFCSLFWSLPVDGTLSLEIVHQRLCEKTHREVIISPFTTG